MAEIAHIAHIVELFREFTCDLIQREEYAPLYTLLREHKVPLELVPHFPDFYCQLLNPDFKKVCPVIDNVKLFMEIVFELCSYLANDRIKYSLLFGLRPSDEPDFDGRVECLLRILSKAYEASQKIDLNWPRLIIYANFIVDNRICANSSSIQRGNGPIALGPFGKLIKFVLLHEARLITKETSSEEEKLAIEEKRLQIFENRLSAINIHTIIENCPINFELLHYHLEFFTAAGQNEEWAINAFATQAFKVNLYPSVTEAASQIRQELVAMRSRLDERLGFMSAMQVPMKERREALSDPAAKTDARGKKRRVASDDRVSALVETLRNKMFSAGPPSIWNAGKLRLGQNAAELAKYLDNV